MKLNFWQWLGIAIIVLGAIGLYLYKNSQSSTSAPPTTTAPVR